MKLQEPESSGTPDPHALRIAAAVQEAVAPDIAILYGSRAAGDYHEDSDVDILVVTDREHHHSARGVAQRAARDYMRQNPPELAVGIISMNRQTFDRCRRASQHIAGQAAGFGIPMAGPSLGPWDEPDRGPDDHWPATLQWLWFACRHRRSLDELVQDRHWHSALIGLDAQGLDAQSAASGILRAWLSTHNPPWRYRHRLELLWERIQELENPEDPQSWPAMAAARELVEYTRVQREGGNASWLDPYRKPTGDGPNPPPINREQQEDLRERVGKLVDAVVELIDQRHGVPEVDPSERPWA